MIDACADLFEAGPATLRGPGDMLPCPPPFLCSKKKKGKQRKARKTFKAETIKRLSLRLKLYCLSHWWPTILFSDLWPLHFEIHFAGLRIHKIHFVSVSTGKFNMLLNATALVILQLRRITDDLVKETIKI